MSLAAGTADIPPLQVFLGCLPSRGCFLVFVSLPFVCPLPWLVVLAVWCFLCSSGCCLSLSLCSLLCFAVFVASMFGLSCSSDSVSLFGAVVLPCFPRRLLLFLVLPSSSVVPLWSFPWAHFNFLDVHRDMCLCASFLVRIAGAGAAPSPLHPPTRFYFFNRLPSVPAILLLFHKHHPFLGLISTY